MLKKEEKENRDREGSISTEIENSLSKRRKSKAIPTSSFFVLHSSLKNI